MHVNFGELAIESVFILKLLGHQDFGMACYNITLNVTQRAE